MPILTVTNEYAAAGYELAARAADLLGYVFVDRQVITTISQISGVPEKTVEHCDETAGGPHRDFTEKLTSNYPELLKVSGMIDLKRYYHGASSTQQFRRKMEGVAVSLDTNPMLRCVLESSEQPKIFDSEECLAEMYLHCLEKALLELAKQDNCVFIGRYARGILRDFPGVVHVGVFAPLHARIQRAVDVLRISEGEAKKLLSDIDATRRKFLLENYSLDCTDHSIYDLLVNTGTFTVDAAARIVAGVV